ncbi:MAG: trigger factor [Ruminococcaceae bacterium]|nr:trigger factor [Oscillospiraceae bacterium]
MSLIKSEKSKKEKNVYTLEFSVDQETFAKAVSNAYHKKVANINVPGFRRGKAPRAVIEKMYGKGFFYEDAFNDVLPAAWEEASKASKLEIVGQPEFDVVSVNEGENGVVFSAKVYVKPDVKLEGYTGIEAEKKVEPVTDEEIDNEINTIRERNARETEVTDGVSVMGDICHIDYEGSVDGVPFDGGKGSDYPLKLGSGNFIPGFEEQVAGHKLEEEFNVNVTFPEDYHAKELAGKDAVFKTVIHKIRHVELPEADDDFAKDVSEFDTFAEYRADMKAKIEKRHEEEADKKFEEQLLDALIEKMKADIPEAMFTAETDNFVRDYENRLRMQGLDLETYFKYTGMTIDSLREQLRPQAEKQVKLRLALEKIAKAEKIKVGKKEIDEEIKRIADAYQMDSEKVREIIPEESVAEDLKVKKAMDLVKAQAVVKA